MTAAAERDLLSRLVGRWQGTVLHRADATRPFTELPGTSENRWVLGGRFVEMTLRAGTWGDTWSAVFYIGFEHNERRYVLVSLETGDSRINTRIGDWTTEHDRLVLTSPQARVVGDMTIPGRLRLELAEGVGTSTEFIRLIAHYETAEAGTAAKPTVPREHRRFVIA